MRQRKVIVFLAVLIFLFLVSACNFVAPTQAPQVIATTVVILPSPAVTVIAEPTLGATPKLPLTEADVPRVPVDVAKAALDSGQAIIVDVRTPDSYQAKHIKGAISIPLGEIELHPTELKLDKAQWIITYCT